MRTRHLLLLVLAAIRFCIGPVRADTLYFQAASLTQDQRINTAYWYVSHGMGHLTPAGRLPTGTDTAILTTQADGQTNNIEVASLILQSSVEVTNGNFSVQTLQMNGGSFFAQSVVNVNAEMDVLAKNCAINQTALNIQAGAFLLVTNTGDLTISSGSRLHNQGEVILTDQTRLFGFTSLAGVTNRFENLPGATLRSSGNAAFTGQSGFLIIDNSGLVNIDTGTLTLTVNDHYSSGGTGTFNTAISSSAIVFNSQLKAPAGATFRCAGPGMSTLLQGADIEGVLQVGAVDPQSSTFSPGNLAIASPGQFRAPV